MVPRDAIEFLGDVVLGSTLMLITFHGISGWGGHDPGPALPPSPKPEGGENGVLVGRGEGGSHLEQRGGKSTMWVGLKSSIHLFASTKSNYPVSRTD